MFTYMYFMPKNQKKCFKKSLITLGLLLSLGGCSTLPHQTVQKLVYTSDTDTSQTDLAKLITPLRNKNPELTGYHILFDPLEAIAARLSLINKAQKTLDLQYYIWDNDKIGALALYEIIKAADRGVKVRLLIDDNNAKKMEGILLALNQHVNIEVKLYNPYKFRNFRPLDMVLDLKRINRRMHNKSFIVDHQIALIGGRNMSNQYFFTSDKYQFSDMDVMLVGKAADEISSSFDDYWNDTYAYSVKDIVNPRQHLLRYPELKAQLAAHYQRITVQNYLNLANHANTFDQWLYHNLQLDWVKAEIVKDSPAKIHGTALPEEYLQAQLTQHLNVPHHNLDIISAYFVPEKQGTAMLGSLAKNGVNVRVLTNSFKANDVWLVHAFYSKYRQPLLESGVHLYEFLPALGAKALGPYTKLLSKEAKISLKDLSRSSLHAKMMAMDDQVFIGSFNLDPRSSRLNSEIGVLLDSPQLAKTIHNTMTHDITYYSYELILTPDQKIEWIREKNNQVKIFPQEPGMSWWQKSGLTFISWLPLEGMM